MEEATVVAWVLLAIGAVSRTDDAPLNDIIAAADAINHAVLLRDELESAVRILEGCGFVKTQGTAIRLTDAGRREIKLAKSRYWDTTWTNLRNRLEDSGTPERSQWQVSTAEFDAAVDAYLHRS